MPTVRHKLQEQTESTSFATRHASRGRANLCESAREQQLQCAYRSKGPATSSRTVRAMRTEPLIKTKLCELIEPYDPNGMMQARIPIGPRVDNEPCEFKHANRPKPICKSSRAKLAVRTPSRSRKVKSVSD